MWGKAKDGTSSSVGLSNLHPDLAAFTQYRFVRELGAGGMSLVYLAENLHMGGRKGSAQNIE